MTSAWKLWNGSQKERERERIWWSVKRERMLSRVVLFLNKSVMNEAVWARKEAKEKGKKTKEEKISKIEKKKMFDDDDPDYGEEKIVRFLEVFFFEEVWRYF